MAINPLVVGSNPTGATFFSKRRSSVAEQRNISDHPFVDHNKELNTHLTADLEYMDSRVRSPPDPAARALGQISESNFVK